MLLFISIKQIHYVTYLSSPSNLLSSLSRSLASFISFFTKKISPTHSPTNLGGRFLSFSHLNTKSDIRYRVLILCLNYTQLLKRERWALIGDQWLFLWFYSFCCHQGCCSSYRQGQGWWSLGTCVPVGLPFWFTLSSTSVFSPSCSLLSVFTYMPTNSMTGVVFVFCFSPSSLASCFISLFFFSLLSLFSF